MATGGSKAQLEHGLGNVTWWGFSPRMQVWPEDTNSESPLNILLVGAGDGRHILHSLKWANDGKEKPEVHFYVAEQTLMLYARQILFLALLKKAASGKAHNDPDSARLILEIYGNLSLSRQTAQTLRDTAEKLKQSVSSNKDADSDNDVPSLPPGVDLGRLKRKEVDALEQIFKIWANESEEEEEEDGGTAVGSMEKPWDCRLRQLLMDRYDARDGLFEMDYQLRLVDRGGAGISHKEYCHWRKTGEAFSWEDSPSTGGDFPLCPNPTLASGLVVPSASGKKETRLGYWGDVVTGPFLGLGFHYSTEVQMTETKLKRPAQDRALSFVTDLIAQIRENKAWPPVTFLSVSQAERELLAENSSKRKFHDFFNSAFIGCGVTHFLTAELARRMRLGAAIYVESPVFLLHVANEVVVKFRDHLQQTCKDSGLDMVSTEGDEMEEIRQGIVFKAIKTSECSA